MMQTLSLYWPSWKDLKLWCWRFFIWSLYHEDRGVWLSLLLANIFKMIWICFTVELSKPVLINLHMPNDFFPTWLFFLISRAFQPLLTIVLGIYHLGDSNLFSFRCILDILCWNLNCKHLPSNMHDQMPFTWSQQASSAIHGPSTRLQRPMQSKIQIPCTWEKCVISHIHL